MVSTIFIWSPYTLHALGIAFRRTFLIYILRVVFVSVYGMEKKDNWVTAKKNNDENISELLSVVQSKFITPLQTMMYPDIYVSFYGFFWYPALWLTQTLFPLIFC